MGDTADDRLQQGLEHLQSAAREMIEATRALLDAAEELVEDPRVVQDLLGTFATVAQATVARFRPGGDDDRGDDDGHGRHVQRIKVS